MTTLDKSIDTIARFALWDACEEWAEREDLWEEEYPDFGEGDVQAIIRQMYRLLPSDVTFQMRREAHTVLADRASEANDDT